MQRSGIQESHVQLLSFLGFPSLVRASLTREYGINQVLISTQNHLYNNYPILLGGKAIASELWESQSCKGILLNKKARVNDPGF